jgi:hypothetical protein
MNKDIDDLFKGFDLKYNQKELLESLLAITTITQATLGALKDLVLINLSELTNKPTEEINNQFKELHSLHIKDVIANVLSEYGEVNNHSDDEEKPED